MRSAAHHLDHVIRTVMLYRLATTTNDDVNKELHLLTLLTPEVQRQKVKTESSLVAHFVNVALNEEEDVDVVEEERLLEIGENLKAEERENLTGAVDRTGGESVIHIIQIPIFFVIVAHA